MASKGVNKVEQIEYIKQLEDALTDIVDGEMPHDLANASGHSYKRCVEIRKLHDNIMEKNKNGK